jgi:hypothetical protein
MVQRIVGDDGFISFNQQDVYDWINEAVLDIIRKTNCNTNVASSPASSFSTGALNSTLIQFTRVLYDTLPLTHITLQQLDNLYINPDEIGVPYYFYWTKQAGIKLFPKPAPTDSTTIFAHYYAVPANVTAGTDTPGVPVAYHYSIVSFCKMRFYERLQNYRAVELASNEYYGAISNQLEEASDKVDQYVTIGDDPFETGFMS